LEKISENRRGGNFFGLTLYVAVC